MIVVNSLNLGLVVEKANEIEPLATMNSADLAGFVAPVGVNEATIAKNKGILASIAPNAMDNATKAGTLGATVDMNSDLIAGYDNAIANNSAAIAPLGGRADMNSD